MRRVTNIVRCVSSLLSMCLALSCLGEPRTPKGAFKIDSLFGESELVATGRVTSVKTLSTRTTLDSHRPQAIASELVTREASVEILRIYKGSSTSTIAVTFYLQTPTTSYANGPDLRDGETVLLFLDASDDGTYRFANSEWGKFGLCPFQPSPSVRGTGSALLEKDLENCLTGDAQSAASALGVLLTFAAFSPGTEAKLDALTRSSRVDVAAEAFANLLGTKKNDYYLALEQFLTIHGKAIPGDALMDIFGRMQDPGPAVDPKIYNDLSDSSLPTIKLGAMYALRKLASSQSVPTLIAHLSDADPNIQYLAVITLNEVVHNGIDYGPTNADFDKNPQLYLTRWQQWWETTGKAEYASR